MSAEDWTNEDPWESLDRDFEDGNISHEDYLLALMNADESLNEED